MNKIVVSPLNYTGAKHKLLSQILPLFPKNIDTFVDLFAGGCNVCINVDAQHLIANDRDQKLIELYRYFSKTSAEELREALEALIKHYGLSDSSKYGYKHYNTTPHKGLANYNKEAYLKLRQAYNNAQSPLMFYALIIFAFNNQIRFNNMGKFNTPVNKRDFNTHMKLKLKRFIQKLHSLEISWSSLDFKKFKANKSSFVYADPPYLVSLATYNEGENWDESREKELLNYLDALDARGIKFALSNLFEHKGLKNTLLIEWSKRYKVHHLNFEYKNCNYQSKNQSEFQTKEVLIVNY